MSYLVMPTKRDTLVTIFLQQLVKKKGNIEKNICKGNLCLDSLDPHHFNFLRDMCLFLEEMLKGADDSMTTKSWSWKRNNFEFHKLSFHISQFMYFYFFIFGSWAIYKFCINKVFLLSFEGELLHQRLIVIVLRHYKLI